MSVCLCAPKALCAGWLAGWARFCSFWSVDQNCNEAAAFPVKRSVLADRNAVLCYCHIFAMKEEHDCQEPKVEWGQDDLLVTNTLLFFPPVSSEIY